MIFDSAAQVVIGNIEWVDKGALWAFDVKNHLETLHVIEGTSYLSIRAGSNGFFCLVHHGSTDQAVSIRRTCDPTLELASVRFNNHDVTFTGDLDLWNNVDPAIVANTGTGQKLLLIEANHRRITELDVSWFNHDNYDLGYQGLVDCLSISSNRVVVAVQRSSELVVIDSKINKRVGSINLGERSGNPMLRMHGQHAFLATDYDTLCKVDTGSLSVVKSARLQYATASNTQLFIGDYDVGSSTCAVARPYSGDVLLINLNDLEVVGRAQVGGQPLQVCMISTSQIISRDWKTGQVTMGQFVFEKSPSA